MNAVSKDVGGGNTAIRPFHMVFPEAQLTHNFPYGETAESRAEGIRQLREAAAEQPQ
jgi:hypothetical protein